MDVTATKKQVKDQTNAMKSKKTTDEEELDRLRNLYLKTEEMKSMAEDKNKEIEDQFKELQTRIQKSSGFLNQIKKSIENIKFSYQRDIIDLEKMGEENRQEIDRQIEDIKMNISKLKSRVETDDNKPQTYEEAFNGVLSTFQTLAQE